MLHKDLEVWKESIKLVKDIYLITKKYPKDELYGIVSQIRRSAVSVPSNIAEGSARNSNKDYIRFLYISFGSLTELETQIIISQELEFICFEESKKLQDQITNISKMLQGLIKYLVNKESK
jgi:four helix bundle protein